MNDVVIAKYAPVTTCCMFAATIAIFAAGWSAVLDGAQTLEQAWTMNNWKIVLCAIATLFTMRAFWVVLQQILFHGGRAVWIENGNLRYTAYQTMPYSSLPVSEIQGLTIKPGFLLRSAQIAIRTKDGGHLMMTSFLSPSAEKTCARLSELLDLPAAHSGPDIL